MHTPAIQNKIVQRPFSVTIRSMTPERNIRGDLKETLIEKPKVLQSNYSQLSGMKREEPKTPVMVKQFELKPQTERRPQEVVRMPQKYQYIPIKISDIPVQMSAKR